MGTNNCWGTSWLYEKVSIGGEQKNTQDSHLHKHFLTIRQYG